MRPRQLWKLLSGVALLVTGFVFGASAPAGATTGGCTGDIVVALDVAVWSRSGHDTYGFTLRDPLPAGEWRVGAASSDAYVGRGASDQTHEQWLLDITDHVVLGPTTDLRDGVDAASVTDDLGTFVSSSGVTHFTVRHSAPSTPSGTNSVTADCVSFTRVAPTPTTTTVPSTTVPSTTVPTTTVPTTTVPTTTVPTTTVPTTTVPTTTVPSTTVPALGPVPGATPTVPPPSTTVLGPAALRASAVVDCAADSVHVLLGNQGDLGATVDVALPMAAIEAGLRIDGGALTTTTLDIGDLEGPTEVHVSDSTSGATYLLTPVDIDCDDPARPTAATVLDCAADVLVVVLGNDAGDPARLTVFHERVAMVAQREVAVGDVLQIEVPLDGASSVPIRVVDDDGTDVMRVEVDNVCAPPAEADPDAGSDSADTGGAGTNGDIDCATSARSAPPCAEVRVMVSPDCPASLADVSIRRDGIGRERFVVLVDGAVAGVVAIDGSGERTIPVSLGSADAELTVSRSMVVEPIVIGTLRCGSNDGRAGPVAAALVVFAVLSTAAGVAPWPVKLTWP
ncbi:MAG: hypothetical protein RIB98_17335 [Acidimicrobiales bacterium]